MNDEKMITLSLNEPQTSSPFQSYEVFTCENCGFGTCERIGKCPHCGRRMLNSTELNKRNNIVKGGLWPIIIGLLYLILPVFFVLTGNFSLRELFANSPTDFMSVSKFTYMFAIPAIFISIGAAMMILKKDSPMLLIFIGAAVFAVFLAADYLIPKVLF